MTYQQEHQIPQSYADLFPLPDPRPIGNCPECRRLVNSRRQARKVFDWSAASDANVLLRSHQHGEH